MSIDSKYRCWAEIDLAALERNLGKIRLGLPPHIQYVAVVKADAYGHGLHQTVARLMQCGADAFAVANVFEAVEVREIGAGWPILVLGALLEEEDPYILDYDLIATLSCSEEVQRLNALGEKYQRVIDVHLKIDTGMGRLGVYFKQALSLYQEILAAKHLALKGIYTHFSSADTDPEYTVKQRQRFLDTLATFPGLAEQSLLIHADNSAGLETFSHDSPFNAVRVGLLQFGLVPYKHSLLARLNPEPVFSFHSRVSLIKELPAGTFISYSRTYQLEKDARVGVITAGYGDGIPVAASNAAKVLIRNQRCSIIGRVTMDQTMVNLTDHPEVQSGDHVTLIGKQGSETIDVAQYSGWCQCIPWETFCSITKRVPRIYKTSRTL